jgi:hypothetical protein
LIGLYDGNLKTARDLSIDELIDHVAFRVNSIAKLPRESSNFTARKSSRFSD